MLISDVISLHIQKEMRKKTIEDLIINSDIDSRRLKFKDAVIEENEIIIKHQNLTNLNFDAYIDKNRFNSIINSEANIEWVRIKEQINNIENLLKTKCQPAWILVSVYYCCFFMANLISKVYGKSLINFSGNDLKDIYKRSNTEVILNPDLKYGLRDIMAGTNNVYCMCFNPKSDDEIIKIQFIKSGDQPHKFTWTNFKSIVNNAGRGNCGLAALPKISFLQKICDSSENRWPLPSQLRNEWNYSSTTSFSSIGTQIAEDFIRFLKNPINIESWENRMCNRTEGGEEDKVISIAYMYIVLKNIIFQIVEQNEIEGDRSVVLMKSAITAKKVRRNQKKKTRSN